MFASHSSALYELLSEHRLVDSARLAALYDQHKATGKPLATLLLELGIVERETLLRKIAEHLGYDYVPVLPAHFSGEAIAVLNGKLARDYGVMPLRAGARQVDLLIANPFNLQAADDLTFALDRNVRLFFADPEKVEIQIRQHYGEAETDLGQVLEEINPGGFANDGRALNEREIEAMVEQAPIIKFVDLVLGQAIRDQASDIHFEPFENEFKIRYRIDGALYEMAPPSKNLALPITSRLKVLANLDIAERRIPQDGRIKLNAGGRSVDLRVSTLPTQFGESIVLRVLDQSAIQLEIRDLGMPDEMLPGVQEIIHRPNGIFIVTGPTGCGKTTTLYSALREINTTDLKILTAEDPVEYEIEGIMQMPVNPAIGLTFAAALRSFLRQDPDVIMVGEIRDVETAQIAIQASLTGHLVLSTLHTNDAAGAVTRLVDMGVEPFLIASTLEAVLAQRLVRRICAECKAPYVPSPELLGQLGIDRSAVGQRAFFYGRGCPACNGTGYRGRLGIFEWLRVTDAVRDLVSERAPTLAIRQKAIEQGMRTLREAGLRAILDGHTSIEEVVKCT